MNYYNDNNDACCRWLAGLQNHGLIGQGTIDNRSIKDVAAADLNGFTRCHFFAGIGGCDYALQLAGWPSELPIWTGSCPCQPFSQAGKKKGIADERHLWPEFFRLIRECHPPVVFGEQVAAAIGHGWLDRVSADLEGEGYSVGAAVLGAHSVGAPHKRQRLYWVAYAESIESWHRDASQQRQTQSRRNRLAIHSVAGGLGDANSARPQKRICDRQISRMAEETDTWEAFVAAGCDDGKSRRISFKPGDEPLAYGLPRSVGPRSTKQQRVELVAAKANRKTRLQGYGNAIVPQVAAEFIAAFMEVAGVDSSLQPLQR